MIRLYTTLISLLIFVTGLCSNQIASAADFDKLLQGSSDLTISLPNQSIIKDGYKFTSYPFQGKRLYFNPVISDTPGQFGVLYAARTKVYYSTLFGCISVKTNSLVYDEFTPTKEWLEDRSELYNSVILNDGRLLMRRMNPDVDYYEVENKRLRYNKFLVDPKTGKNTDITPTNYADIVPTDQSRYLHWDGYFEPPNFYTEQHGLSEFILDKAEKVLYLYQGTAELTMIQQVKAYVPLYANYYSNNEIKRLWVLDGGEVLAYDKKIGYFKRIPDLDELGKLSQQNCRSHANDNCVLTRSMVVMEENKDIDVAISLFNSDGEETLLYHYGFAPEPLDQQLIDLKERWTELLDNHEEDRTSKMNDIEKLIGELAPPYLVSSEFKIIPIDRTRVGIFDEGLQRLVTIELAD